MDTGIVIAPSHYRREGRKALRAVRPADVSQYGQYMILDTRGAWANVRITSIKAWKMSAEIRIGCKYGLYEYFYVWAIDGDTWAGTALYREHRVAIAEQCDVERLVA